MRWPKSRRFGLGAVETAPFEEERVELYAGLWRAGQRERCGVDGGLVLAEILEEVVVQADRAALGSGRVEVLLVEAEGA
jgi:hypothetical protein